ncbi:unnamed protein product [Acanthoscelides obtectus]|uniref:Uncharacterized protein n=1 Tax=Acanthoscelides obtectus TaxID=200917 RepID=A0A9P0PIN2_ACAOB|nr:unnamed protein product [Acanthoscelides obtectus]CAK1666198.1 hypothetical protein AOBTE_LOCUS25206 [Acanthoscelides obtectus]
MSFSNTNIAQAVRIVRKKYDIYTVYVYTGAENTACKSWKMFE